MNAAREPSDEIILIRPYSSADFDRLVAIRMLAGHAYPSANRLDTADAERTRRYLAQSDSFGVAAEVDGVPEGFVVAMNGWMDDMAGTVSRGLCHIAAVFVTPDFWGRRLATRMLAAVLDAARMRGYDRAQLWTQSDNTRAQRLYRKLGFSTDGVSKMDDRGDRIVRFECAL